MAKTLDPAQSHMMSLLSVVVETLAEGFKDRKSGEVVKVTAAEIHPNGLRKILSYGGTRLVNDRTGAKALAASKAREKVKALAEALVTGDFTDRDTSGGGAVVRILVRWIRKADEKADAKELVKLTADSLAARYAAAMVKAGKVKAGKDADAYAVAVLAKAEAIANPDLPEIEL